MSHSTSIRCVLIDHDRPLKILLERHLPETGKMVLSLRSGENAGEYLARERFDVSQLDFELPGIGRVETRHRHEDQEGADVVVIDPSPETTDSSFGDTTEREILAALGSSAGEEFLTKPFIPGEVSELARRLRSSRLASASSEEDMMLGKSAAMRELLEVVERVAAGSASVLIHGETGTGKTMVARRLHQLSPRGNQRFVAINCSAFQDQLLESELFGHEKGAFTGATSIKQGLFEVAHGGTLFLDEIGDMSAAMQAKLLQVLDAGDLRRVGGTKQHKVDVRIVAASNKDLGAEVKAGRFREDLLFRLKVIYLRMPRLADRRSDIPMLIEHFLDRFRVKGQGRKQFSPEAIQALMGYAWPGNVRELGNMVEGLILLSRGIEIDVADLPAALRPKTPLVLDDELDYPLPMVEIERLHIQRTLLYTEGKKAAAARLLGVDVKTLASKIKLYGLEA